MAKTTNLYC